MSLLRRSAICLLFLLSLPILIGIPNDVHSKVVVLEREKIYGRLAILIVLDAVNHTVLEELLANGSLPNIQRAISSGMYIIGRTRTSTEIGLRELPLLRRAMYLSSLPVFFSLIVISA